MRFDVLFAFLCALLMVPCPAFAFEDSETIEIFELANISATAADFQLSYEQAKENSADDDTVAVLDGVAANELESDF